jgi:hypothetical protein
MVALTPEPGVRMSATTGTTAWSASTARAFISRHPFGHADRVGNGTVQCRACLGREAGDDTDGSNRVHIRLAACRIAHGRRRLNKELQDISLRFATISPLESPGKGGLRHVGPGVTEAIWRVSCGHRIIYGIMML